MEKVTVAKKLEWFGKFVPGRLLKLTATDQPVICESIDKFIFCFGHYPYTPHGLEDLPHYQERWTKFARWELEKAGIVSYRQIVGLLMEARDYFMSAIENDMVWSTMLTRMKNRAVDQLSEGLFDWTAIESNRTMFCRCGHALTRTEVLEAFGLE